MITYEDLVGAWLGIGATGDAGNTVLRLTGPRECPRWALDRLDGPLSPAVVSLTETQGSVEFDDGELTVTLEGCPDAACAETLRFEVGPTGIRTLRNDHLALGQLRLLVGLPGSSLAPTKGTPGGDAWVWSPQAGAVEIRHGGDGSLWICEYATSGSNEAGPDPLLCLPDMAMISKPREGSEGA